MVGNDLPEGPTGMGATAKSFPTIGYAGWAMFSARILVEHGAGAGVEAGNDLVEAPVHAVLGRVALLVEVDEELEALDGAGLVEGAGAVLVEPVALAVHRCHEHVPAAEATLAAAQAVTRLAGNGADLLRIRHEVVERRGRTGEPGLLEQLLVVEHGADVEAVGNHVGRVLDDAAELQRAVGELAGVLPLGEPGLQALELAVAGVEREPAFGHLHHVRDLAALHHRQQLLEGLAPGQRNDIDGDARVRLLIAIDELL